MFTGHQSDPYHIWELPRAVWPPGVFKIWFWRPVLGLRQNVLKNCCFGIFFLAGVRSLQILAPRVACSKRFPEYTGRQYDRHHVW